jgi:hypothetical protein
MRSDYPARRVNLVACPVLVCVCERDVIARPARAVRMPFLQNAVQIYCDNTR